MLKRLMEILKEKGLDYNSFFFLYRIVNNIPIYNEILEEDPDRLLALGYIYYEEEADTIMLQQQGIDFIKETVKELKKAINKEVRQGDLELRNTISSWMDEYRALFKGTKVGAMGDPKACLDKMIRFFTEYPDYANKDIIFNATKKYIQTEANQNYKYLQRADYFIYKVTGKEETSRLASFCSDAKENQSLEHSFTQVL